MVMDAAPEMEPAEPESEPGPVQTVTVLYLAGMPRTGSTILGELLDRVPDVIHAGELVAFWRRYTQRELCSCGKPLPDCEFWSSVVSEAFGELLPGRAEFFAQQERRFVGPRALRLLYSTRRAAGSAAAHELFRERNRLYAAVSRVSGSSWIVDASTDAEFGACAAALGTAAIDIVHIVRDPRGVAYSWEKQVPSDSEPCDLPRLRADATAVQWMMRNLFVATVVRRLANRYVRVRYEDLVAAPELCLRRVSEATGLPVPDPRAVVEDLAREPEGHHRISGNPGVRRRGNAVRFALDEEWKVGLSARERRTVTVLCAPLMTRYGYRLRTLHERKTR
jgi:hypothetical protein